MRADEALDFFRQQSARAEKGFIAAKTSSSRALVALSARQLFKTRLMQGLIQWRQLEDPTSSLNAALDAVEDGFEALLVFDRSISVEFELPLARAAIVALLVGRPIRYPPNLAEGQAADRRLDCLLVSALCDEPIEDALTHEMDQLSEEIDAALVARNYRTYFDLLSRASFNNSFEALISAAEGNFMRRAASGFYSGGEQTEGGGLENELIVDYRLGVVLKKVSYRSSGRHAWRW